MKRFALIGAGGYIAPRHLRAIKETGNVLVAALDKNDSVGILDSYTTDVDFFTEFERFDRHLEKLRREGQAVDYVIVCSPNYLHDTHVRHALRMGADVICEKPLVLNPWNIPALECVERETGGRINTIMQLRLHPSIDWLKKRIDRNKIYDIDLTYIAPRGRWYQVSWKGDINKSGGIVTNIGIHFFDVLTWIFGPVHANIVHVHKPTHAAGLLELEHARVRWFLSLDQKDLPERSINSGSRAYRSLMLNGEEIDLSNNFDNLHTESYKRILVGNGFRPSDILPSIQIVSDIRNASPIGLIGDCHPALRRKYVCS